MPIQLTEKYQRDAKVLWTSLYGVLEAAPDGIVLVDPAGRIVLVNSQAERLFGYAHDMLIGQSVEVLVPDGFRPTHHRHREGYVSDPRARAMGSGLQLSGLRADRSEFPVEISLSPIKIEGNTFVMAAGRDVTRRRQVEEALKAANLELEGFTYSVSHDLRAPIRQIDGFARILTEELGPNLSEKGAHYLARIQQGATHMARLVDDLLALARLGRQDVRPR